MVVRCGSCSFEDERDLTVERSAIEVLLADGPYREPSRTSARARKLAIDLAARAVLLGVVAASRRTGRDGLDALALAIGQNAVRVQRKRLLLLATSEVSADPAVEKLTEPTFHRVVVRERHGCAPCTQSITMEMPKRIGTRRRRRHSEKQTTWAYAAVLTRTRVTRSTSRCRS